MIVVGMFGEEIGTVERLEIDKTGRLKSLVVRIRSSLGTNKRIAVDHIRSIQDGIVRVAVSAAEISLLADVWDPEAPQDLWADDSPLDPVGS